jgi:phage/plasmid primase-like uncharacterized protein
MVDITNILGGPYRPPAPQIVDPPETQLRNAILQSGMTPPDEIHLDGQLHRFASGTKGKPGRGDKPGWYVAWSDSVPAGRFGCWRAGIEVAWKADVGRELSAIEEMAHAKRMREAQELRKREQEKRAEIAADVVSEIWAAASLAEPSHPYLARKGIQPHGARVTGDGRLVVPMYNPDNQLCSLQYIDADGTKRYHTGAPTGGAFFVLGSVETEVCIVEGYATGATIYEVTGKPVAVAYSASNLPKVAQMLRQRHGKSCRIIVVADHDEHGVGQKYADQAAQQSGSITIMPLIPGMDANDYWLSGHDLVGLLNPKPDGWLVPASEFASEPAPIKWLIKRWLQADALVMLHGQSGGGKTFVLLDMLCTLASAKDRWQTQTVRHGSVVYLAGEGHQGLRGRLAAWMQHHGVNDLRLWVSKDGCDLNTPEGYQRVVDSIRALDVVPAVIAVDTLHRFLAGDENSAQDAKTMIDACAGLMREFGCSVVLVHHTGVSEEAQHRARGSSAWKGALDIEISVQPMKNRQIALIQRKSKDAEMADPLWLELQSVTIKGWVDEDGEPVGSAVIVEGAPPSKGRPNHHSEWLQTLFEAWDRGGRERQDGHPYVTSSVLRVVMEENGDSKDVIKKALQESAGRMIGKLIEAGTIERSAHGWTITDEEVKNQWAMIKK